MRRITDEELKAVAEEIRLLVDSEDGQAGGWENQLYFAEDDDRNGLFQAVAKLRALIVTAQGMKL